MACFLRTFLCSDAALKEKMKMDELETAVMMLTAQLDEEKSEKAALEQQLCEVKAQADAQLEEEKSEKAVLEQQLCEVRTQADSLRATSSSIRAAASMKMQRWWARPERAESFAIYTEDGGSEKGSSADESTADESTAHDSGSDTEQRACESPSRDAESKDGAACTDRDAESKDSADASGIADRGTQGCAPIRKLWRGVDTRIADASTENDARVDAHQ